MAQLTLPTNDHRLAVALEPKHYTIQDCHTQINFIKESLKILQDMLAKVPSPVPIQGSTCDTCHAPLKEIRDRYNSSVWVCIQCNGMYQY